MLMHDVYRIYWRNKFCKLWHYKKSTASGFAKTLPLLIWTMVPQIFTRMFITVRAIIRASFILLHCFAGDFQGIEPGERVVEESEYELIMKLKDLKKRYREYYAELQKVRSEVQYCQKLVDQCRQRLISGWTCFSSYVTILQNLTLHLWCLCLYRWLPIGLIFV